MKAVTGPRVAAALSATAVAISGALVAPAPASAAPLCSSLGVPGGTAQARCARVIGINPGSYLGVRTAPSYGAPIVDKLYNGDVVEMDCWTTGDGAADNPSYKYWIRKYNAAALPRYVNDWYLDSGSPNVWMQQIPHC